MLGRKQVTGLQKLDFIYFMERKPENTPGNYLIFT